MAYYTALITAWNGATQPPAGVTGTGLTAGMTTQQKIDAVNGWTMTGTVPTSFFTTGDQVFNCVNYTEFKALTATQQANLLAMLTTPGKLLGGSANNTSLLVGMVLDFFAAGTVTRTALLALAKGTVLPWWQVPVASNGGGLSGPVSLADTQKAGLV